MSIKCTINSESLTDLYELFDDNHIEFYQRNVDGALLITFESKQDFKKAKNLVGRISKIIPKSAHKWHHDNLAIEVFI